MSIRLRTVDGVRVALCAARSVAKVGDVYLDDADHHALSQKFTEDFVSEHLIVAAVAMINRKEARLRLQEESNNVNRVWWDRMYGPSVQPVQSIAKPDLVIWRVYSNRWRCTRCQQIFTSTTGLPPSTCVGACQNTTNSPDWEPVLGQVVTVIAP